MIGARVVTPLSSRPWSNPSQTHVYLKWLKTCDTMTGNPKDAVCWRRRRLHGCCGFGSPGLILKWLPTQDGRMPIRATSTSLTPSAEACTQHYGISSMDLNMSRTPWAVEAPSVIIPSGTSAQTSPGRCWAA